MAIFDDAPRIFIDTELVRTFIANFWGSYFKAIVIWRVIPTVIYLGSTISYFSYFLFRHFKDDIPIGMSHGARQTLDSELLCLIIVAVCLAYNMLYEFL